MMIFTRVTIATYYQDNTVKNLFIFAVNFAFEKLS